MSFLGKIRADPSRKELVLRLLVKHGQGRPYWWVKAFVNPFVHRRGRRVTIGSGVRLDLVPFRKFSIGDRSVIESNAIINNGMGDVIIGRNTFIGIANTVIGPVVIGDNVMFAQHVTVVGMNHGYQDLNTPIRDQPCTTALTRIGDDSWIGAGAVVNAGISVGRHSVVGAGSVVTKDVPDFTIVGGNPARVLKSYNPSTGEWERPPYSGPLPPTET